VLGTLIDTLMIVVVVIFLFLGSFRSVLVPVVAIPVSLIGGVFLMQAFGFTLNLLTLLAIVLSVGLVVDDAIVVVENVERHLREGRTPFQAALVGAQLIGPLIAMTITLAAVTAYRSARRPHEARSSLLPCPRRRVTISIVADALKMRREAAPQRRARRARFHRLGQSLLRPLAPGLRTRVGPHNARASGGLCRLGRAQPAGHSDVYVFAERTRARRGPGIHVRHHQQRRERVRRSEEPFRSRV
jgi:hypothetical protein